MIDQATAHRIDIDGDPLVYDRTSGSPVLLIHGWGGSGRYWGSLIDRLDDRFGFVVPDLPGVGRSLPVHRARSLFGQVLAVERLIDHLGLDRLDIVGHSMGGAMAVLLAARRPTRVRRLVLTSIAFYRNEVERRAFSNVALFLELQLRLRMGWTAGVPAIIRQAARQYFYRVPDDAELLRLGYLDYLTMDFATAVASAKSAASPKIPAAGRAVRAPTLIIACRQDRHVPPENVAVTASTIPNCRVAWIDQCGHLPMVEKPDEYAALVGDFLSN